MIFLGIDPGKSGGLVALQSDGNVVVTAEGRVLATPMPETDLDVIDWLVNVGVGPGLMRATLERVSSSPQMGVTSAFTFGRGYGALRMALTARGIAFDEVVPRKWQAAIGCLSGGDKNVTKAKAQALFPGIKVTHAISDALLIAEYGRRLHR